MSGYQLTEADRQRLGLAVHEAAHAVVGALQGGTVERASLIDDGTDGECTFTEDSFTHDSRRYARSLVAAAGPVASAVFAHGQRVTMGQLERYLGDGDREELRLAAIHSDTSVDGQLWEAVPAVTRCWRSIGTLAAEIFAGGEITHDDVLGALGVTDGGGPRSSQLSMIASGGAAPRPLKVKAKASA